MSSTACARPDLDHPTADDVAPAMADLHGQPVPWLEPEEISAAVVYLASESARHITGTVLSVDAGASARFTGCGCRAGRTAPSLAGHGGALLGLGAEVSLALGRPTRVTSRRDSVPSKGKWPV